MLSYIYKILLNPKWALFLFTFLLSNSFITSNSQNQIFEKRYVENISTLEYLGDVQVWCIETDDNETIFTATAKGISVFDGVRWSNFPLPSSNIIRYLTYDSSNKRLYSAADNEFGFWEMDIFGQYIYSCLYKTPSTSPPDIFWRVMIKNEVVYFQTHSKICTYNKLTKTIETILSGNNIGYIHNVNGNLYTQIEDRLLKEVCGKFVEIEGVIPNRITGIFPHNESLLLVTEEKGLYTITESKTSKLVNPIDPILSKAQIFSTTTLNDSTYLFGSVLNGLFIVNDKLEIIDHIDYQHGLNHTTILNLKVNRDGDIWLGLDGGLANIKKNPQEVFLQNKNSEIGTIYDATNFQNHLFVATNKGLFVYETPSKVRFIEGSQGQIWTLAVINNKMYICHDKGLFILQDNKLVPYRETRVWKLSLLDNTAQSYLSFDIKGGFSVYKVIENKLVFIKKIEGLIGGHTDAGIDRFGQIWVQDRSSCPIRISLDEHFNVKTTEKYDLPKGINNFKRANVDNDIIFYENKTAYKYDINSNMLIKDHYYSVLLSQMLFEPTQIMQINDNFFYSSRDQSGYIKRFGKEFINYGEIFQSNIKYTIPTFAHKFILIDSYTIGLGGQNGIALYLINNHEKNQKQRNIEISQIILNQNEIESKLPINAKHKIEIPFDYSNIQLFFSGLYDHHQISYSINNEEWGLAKGSPFLELPHLSPGKYQVKIKNMESNHKSDNIIKLQFHVINPWYLTSYFFIFLISTIFIIILFVRQLFKYRMKKQQDIFLKKQALLLENEKKEYDLKILKIKLKEEEKQLVNLTMEGIKRNGILSEIKKEIASILNLSLEQKGILNKIIKKIDSHLNNNDTQELFEKYFNEIYDGFFDRLMTIHPTLTTYEMKLCAFIKLNLNSKEIAIYLNISPNSVEIARHRLRKKLELNANASLREYIAKI